MSDHTCGGRGAVPCPACTALAAQDAYAKAWRAQSPDDTFGPPHCCPLCGEALQVKLSDAAEYAAAGGGDLLTDDIASHQRWHGSDWLAYEAAAAVPDDPR